MFFLGEGPPSSGPSSNCGSEHSYNYPATATNSLSQGSTIDQGSVVNIEDDVSSHYSDGRGSVQQYNKYRVSPNPSPNQSTDRAISDAARKNKRLNPFSTFFSTKKDKHVYGSNQNLYGSHGHLAGNQNQHQNHHQAQTIPESRNFRTIREYSPRAFKFYMEQR